jgi:hypothetical protein
LKYGHSVRRLAVIGFQKSGTTAFVREAQKLDFVHVHTNINGSLEVPWPLIKKLEEKTNYAGSEKNLLVHKFSAYHSIPDAINYLIDSDPNRQLIILVRNPMKILISWWNHHKNLAVNGSKLFPQHFAVIEKFFYANCSLDEYYKKRFVSFRHDVILNDLIEKIPNDRLMVVSHERLATDINHTVSAIIQRSIGNFDAVQKAELKPSIQHIGFADRNLDILDAETGTHLSEMYGRMKQAVLSSGVWHLL